MAVVYLDCFSGVSGNMLLGGLLDLGLPEELLRSTLAKLPVSGYELQVSRVEKQGISAAYVDVKLTKRQHHRHLPDILDIIAKADLAPAVRENAAAIFLRLAAAEAKVHNAAPEDVHFHEVGAVDAIIDIVGTAFGFHELGIGEVYASKLHAGAGFVKCAHGVMPVPAPATAELLQGIPWYGGDIKRELVTPTGAAIISVLSKGFGTMPDRFVSRKIGYGAGTWNLEIPNVLRILYGDIQPRQDQLLVIECNIDDMNPQDYPAAMDRLFAAGALDVWLTPAMMKKSRPAHVLSVLAPAAVLEMVAQTVLNETTSIGLRYFPVERLIADRSELTVQTVWGVVRVKVSRYQGKVCQITPEYEDCLQLSQVCGEPVRIIRQEALAAAFMLPETD
ncbi:MAG: nickel pincer cofactor biosynthesis protein LarC [Sporomusaceae bacterium]|nr:nickel pincer cofactor biosynthesis protein LarC [Sporomusaceae bacterium]